MKKSFFVIILLVLFAASGAVAFFWMRPSAPAVPDDASAVPSSSVVSEIAGSNASSSEEEIVMTPSADATTTASIRSALTANGWTVTVDRDIPDGELPTGGDLAGTARAHEYIAERPDTKIQPVVTVFRITDPSELVKDVAGLKNHAATVGGRDGYLFDVPAAVTNSAFALVGKTEVLFVEFGLKGFGNLMPWGENDPSPELVQLIKTLPIR